MDDKLWQILGPSRMVTSVKETDFLTAGLLKESLISWLLLWHTKREKHMFHFSYLFNLHLILQPPWTFLGFSNMSSSFLSQGLCILCFLLTPPSHSHCISPIMMLIILNYICLIFFFAKLWLPKGQCVSLYIPYYHCAWNWIHGWTIN